MLGKGKEMEVEDMNWEAGLLFGAVFFGMMSVIVIIFDFIDTVKQWRLWR